MSRFQSPADFFQVFIQQVEAATDSVYIQSLTLEVGEVMDQLGPALIRAAGRGVKVELHIDWISRDYVHGKIAFAPRFKPSQRRYAAALHQKNRIMVQALKDAGVTVVFVNKPDWLAKILAVAGRNHIKMYMVDTKIVWLGGVNILDLALQHIDFMVAYTDQAMIKVLETAFFATNWRDEVLPFSGDSTLLIDGGKRGKSVIYDRALRLIDQAEQSIVFVSQFVPDGVLLKALVSKAKAGCAIKIITSPATAMQFSQWPYKVTYLKCQQALKKVGVQITHLPKKVHCKLLLVDEDQALFGSHNLIETGIKLGTAEVDIQTTESDIVAQLVGLIHSFSRL